jgi:Holliday junction resolvasome RuvABC endonuclease subunit
MSINILGVDQASHFAYCVMDENFEIKTYGVEDYSKYEVSERNAKIKDRLNELINTYEISIVGLEDTFMQKFYNPKTKSMQNNVQVFKTLSKLLGVLECNLFEREMCSITWTASEWRSKCNYKFGKTRQEQKDNAIKFVREKFDIDTDDDNIAEAICIAYATVKKAKRKK